MRFLVTAGNTRESIDRVRDWGNIFTGGLGLAIATALASAGHVDLLTSNRTHLAQLADGPDANPNLSASPFTTHAELKAALADLMARHRYDAIFMTAAVADYRPVRVFAVLERAPDDCDPRHERWLVSDIQQDKVKSTHDAIAVLAERTEKLVDLFRTEWRHRGILVKFKLEVGLDKDVLLQVAEASRLASGADYLVANTLDMLAGDNPGAYLLSDAGHEWVPRDHLPSRMLQLARPKSV